MFKETVIRVLKEHLKEIRAFKVLRLSIFGSVARNQDTPNSDLDLLVKFDGDASFDQYMDLKFFLEDLFSRKIDLVTESAIRPEIQEYVKKDLIRVA